MAAKRIDAVWNELDAGSLEGSQAMAYGKYKEAYRIAKSLKEQFEEGMQSYAPDGKRLVFGYNFGKLSVAIVDDDRKPKAKGAVALADLLKRA